MGVSALCTVDDASCFHMIRLELKTSVFEMNVTVVSTVTGCDVTTMQQHCKGSTSTKGANKKNKRTAHLSVSENQQRRDNCCEKKKKLSPGLIGRVT